MELSWEIVLSDGLPGKKTFDHLKAYGKDAKKPNGEKLAADISKSESKFQKAFTKAEAKGACDPEGDAPALEAKVRRLRPRDPV